MDATGDLRIRIERAVALGLALAALVALPLLVDLLLDLQDGRPVSLRGQINSLAALSAITLALGLGAWIAARGPRTLPASSLALSLSLGGSAWVLGCFLTILWVFGPEIGRIAPVVVAVLMSGIYLSAWALARFLAAFPAPLSVERLTAAGVTSHDAGRGLRVIQWVTSGWAGVVGTVLMMLAMSQAALTRALGLPRADALGLLVLILPLLPLGVGVLAVERQRRSADAEGRRRLRWIWTGVVGGFVLFAAAGLVAGVLTPVAEVFAWLVSAFFAAAIFCCVCFTIAVLARGDLDADLALRRTLVYSATGVLAAIAFVALQSLLQSYVLNALGVPDGAAGLIAGATLAVAFGPAQKRLDAWVARRLPGAGD